MRVPGEESNVLERGTQEKRAASHPHRLFARQSLFPNQSQWACTRIEKKLNETKRSIIRMAIKAGGRSRTVTLLIVLINVPG